MAASRHRLADQNGTKGDSVAAAIAKNFEGDTSLYDAFAASCRQQFKIDASVGQAACTSGDFNTLRRLCHDLKSVMLVLGFVQTSQLAAHAEKAAEAGELSALRDDWSRLRSELLRKHLP